MNFINKIFGKDDSKNLMDNAPYLSPWYFSDDKPKLYRKQKPLKWESFGKEGVIALTDGGKTSYGFINMGSYLLPSTDNKSFLIWRRDLEKVLGLQTIYIYCYEVNLLGSFLESHQAVSEMKQQKQPFLFSVEPVAKIKFQMNPRDEAMKVDFPDAIKEFGEFIIITELQNLYENPMPDKYWHNTTMLRVIADKGWVFNYPQDWFNQSDADFGYVWITRAIRNPKTNLIHAQGIRMSDFVLDETNKQRLDKK